MLLDYPFSYDKRINYFFIAIKYTTKYFNDITDIDNKCTEFLKATCKYKIR